MIALPLDQIVRTADGFSLAFRASPEDPGFAGHFPDDPVAPAALILAWMHAALAASGAIDASRGALPRAKFLSPIRPGDVLELSWKGSPKGWEVILKSGETIAATALFPTHGT